MKTGYGLSLVTSIAAFLVAGSAFAAQNVANTSQKGSLLVFPLITASGAAGDNGPTDTFIEISNDANAQIHVECTYVNEKKGRVSFDFNLTAKQTVSWDVVTREGDKVTPPPFPTNAGKPAFPGNRHRGELICFATNFGSQFQVAWNNLTGTATVINLSDPGADQPEQAFKYNAWAFAARNAAGLAPDNSAVSHGTPGLLSLTGAALAGVYDACPAYNIANFMPNGAHLGNLTTIDNDLSVVSCNQDLRETYNIHTTKLDFTIWNSFEASFHGTHACVDSVDTVPLGVAHGVVQGSNFDFSTLATPNARFEVRGVKASPPCGAGTEVSGLLSVLASSTAIGGGPTDLGEDVELGNTTDGAGSLPGFVRWDPSTGTTGKPQR